MSAWSSRSDSTACTTRTAGSGTHTSHAGHLPVSGPPLPLPRRTASDLAVIPVVTFCIAIVAFGEKIFSRGIPPEKVLSRPVKGGDFARSVYGELPGLSADATARWSAASAAGLASMRQS